MNPEPDHNPQAAIPPWLRPAEPEHPMMLDGGVVGGDTRLQLRCLAEELLMCGYRPEHVEAMSRDPEYQALYAARCALGDGAAGQILAEAAARLGRHTHRVWEETGTDQPATLTIGKTNQRGAESPSGQKNPASEAPEPGTQQEHSDGMPGASAPGVSVSRWFNSDLKRPQDTAGD